MDPLVLRLKNRLKTVLQRINTVFAQSGRDGDVPSLIVVTKHATSIETQAVVHAMEDCSLPARLGESRVQSLIQKATELDRTALKVHWELIGSLQRNKARQAMRQGPRIHSLDRMEILECLNLLGLSCGRTITGLLQVKIANEATKRGFAPEEVPRVIEALAKLEAIHVTGLMCMAPKGSDHESARPCFASLRELRDRVAPDLPELSMGMSNDYEGAILEGSSILRIGSALFAGIET